MDTLNAEKPAEFRLTEMDSKYLATVIHQGAREGALTMVYCRHAVSGELHPILAAVRPDEDGNFTLVAVARLFAPGQDNTYLPPSDEDNAPAEEKPRILLPGGGIS